MAEYLDQVFVNWSLNPEEIKTRAEEAIAKSKSMYDEVGSLNKEELTLDNFIKVLAENDREYSIRRSEIDFPQHVSSNKLLREASTEADKKLSEFDVEMSMRQDVFDNLIAFQKKVIPDTLEPEAKRYLERLIKFGRRNGLHLPKNIQDEIKSLKKRESDIGIDFNKNLNEENTILEFNEDELAGLPEDIIKRLDKTEDGKLKVSLKYPDYFPIMRKCHVPTSRQKMEYAFNSRCIIENTKIMEELVELRARKAELLGFPTHASFILDMRMAKTPEAVADFLSDLTTKLRPLQKEEIQLMLEYKEEECKKYNIEFDGKINAWDMRYYMTMVEEKKYAIDQNMIKEYFPLEVVTKGLLDIYQELLGLKFTQITNPPVWHEDVKMFTVSDFTSHEFLGHFYLDLHPREGKYGHAACFGLQPGCLKQDGSRQTAVAAMVANFTKPTNDKPSLLIHDEVETFFHEFGHVMHQICAKANYRLFSGTRVERDFVEAPSQMLENWCWEKDPLERMSAHYQTHQPLPDTIIQKLVAAKNANAGIFNLRQIMLGTFDQKIHTSKKADTRVIYSQVSDEILKIQMTPGTNMSASFGHLADGYDAQYYGYLWSEVFCMDMFYSRFKKEGIMNSKVGAEYRKFILEPGGSMDAADMLKNFLGREPLKDAFLVSKGLKI